jgi:lipoprotein-releasing system ATP-binding protein
MQEDPVSSVLTVQNLAKSFTLPNGTSLTLFQDVSFSIQRGEILAIVGASGAGKSTLLHLLGGLDTPTKGSLTLHGKQQYEYASLHERTLAHMRNSELGFVFQFHHLLPEFSVIENVCMPAFIAGLSRKTAMDRASELLVRVGLQDRLHAFPATLSGGEQQRTAFARALIMQPAVVLADEPTGNLDAHNAQEIFTVMQELRSAFQQTFVIVTHSTDIAHHTDRIMTLQHGSMTVRSNR